jgi:hypothetical protein
LKERFFSVRSKRGKNTLSKNMENLGDISGNFGRLSAKVMGEEQGGYKEYLVPPPPSALAGQGRYKQIETPSLPIMKDS